MTFFARITGNSIYAHNFDCINRCCPQSSSLRESRHRAMPPGVSPSKWFSDSLKCVFRWRSVKNLRSASQNTSMCCQRYECSFVGGGYMTRPIFDLKIIETSYAYRSAHSFGSALARREQLLHPRTPLVGVYFRS